MGTIINISIGNYGFIAEKNTFGNLLLPFSTANLHIEEEKTQPDSVITKRYFSLSIAQMKDVLDYTGHTLAADHRAFEHGKENKVDIFRMVEEVENRHRPTADEVEKHYSFDEWCSAVKKYATLLANDTFDDEKCEYRELEKERKKVLTVSEQMVIDTLPFGSFGLYDEDADPWDVFRVIVEAFPEDEVVTLDYTELFEAGWCDAEPSEEEYDVPKTIVLTEGKFDAEVISESIQLLYPHMAKFFSFVDFDAYKVQGSTNFVTHYFKLFASLGVKNQVVALYDNDAAGKAELITLGQMKFPPNFTVMSLPDLDIAKQYPTITNDGIVYQDVNGCACSIEMFLGRDILTENGELIPVEWEAFIPKAKATQGKVRHKKSIQERFRNKIKVARDTGAVEEVWNEMHILLQSIFRAFR